MSVVPVIAAGTFYPKSLFSNSEQGVWYDPSDLSTMYEDSAGTTAVHTPGNGTADSPVGKILDKSGNGNHATQATSTARPTLSARYNLLTYSEALDNAAWTKTNMTATDGATDPNGGSTAETLVASAANGTVTQSFTAVATDYTFSVYLKRKTGTGNIDISCNSGGTWVTKTITSSWAQYSVTQTLTAGSKTPGIRIVTSGDEVYAWGADLRASNDGVGLPAYQRIADANTYDSTGFPYYLKSDGTDDNLATGSIDFTGTGVMNYFVGFRKLTDPTEDCIVAMGTSYSANGFEVAGSGYFSSPKGPAIQSLGPSYASGCVNGVTSPTTKVFAASILRGQSTAAGTYTMRLNAVSQSLSYSGTANLPTGNFANSAVYLYRRSFAASLWFNGRTYGIIVRGASCTSTEIANTETWLNTKTKAY